MSQHPLFQIPVSNQSAITFVRSLLDLTIQETMVGRETHYRKIVHCLRGRNAQDLYNIIKSASLVILLWHAQLTNAQDLEYCQGKQSLKQRRDVLRRIMTSFAQASGSLPAYLVLNNIVHERDLGSGAYGTIALCMWHKRSKADRIQVVTKTLSMQYEKRTTEDLLKVRALLLSVLPLLTQHSICSWKLCPYKAYDIGTSSRCWEYFAAVTYHP